MYNPAVSLSLLSVALFAASGHLVPVDLRCENLTNPIGIDRVRPHLSWKVRAARPELRGLSQRGYRILVASDPSLLAPGKADLWDSGKVASGDTFGIEYAGKELGSGQAGWWTVQTWDEAGNESEWSPAAHFSLGLLSPSDWKAKWIAIDAPDGGSIGFKGASWIWKAGEPKVNTPAGTHSFYKTVSIDDLGAWTGAVMDVTADDQFKLLVNGTEVAASDGKTDAWGRPVHVDIFKHLVRGDNEIRIVATNDLAGYAGVIAKLELRPKSGKTMTVVTDKSWLTEDSKAAQIVGAFGAAPWGSLGARIERPATYYRKDFLVAPQLKRATAYVTALGLVDLHLNGKRVSEDLFTPGWTDYTKRILYRAYDVTKSLKPGTNAVGAILGDGWYSGYVGFGGNRAHYGERPRVMVQVNLEYADGRSQTVATSDDWQASTGGITEQDFLMGEEFDARKEPVGWAKSGFKAVNWQKPYVVNDVKASVEAFPSVPVQPYERLKAKSVKEVQPGVYILDFGQNLAGFAQLKVKGGEGQAITLRFAEVLNPDGTLYTANLRSARAIDTYICSGKGTENWAPRFTFHGFRYLEVSGLGHKPSPGEILAVAISSATPEVGSIETSDPMLNRLSKNAWWTQKMNFIDIPTDCPQRDERLGWTGDAQAYIKTATLYSDVHSFFDKWLVTLDDGQRKDGQFPMVAPVKVAGDDGGPAWADAGVICPWTIYDVYGDKNLLARHYPQMKKFIEFCRNRSTAELLPPANFHCFGDWLSINADTPTDVIYEAYFAGSTTLVAKAAEALGKMDEAREYRELASRVREAFNKAYVSPDGVVKGDTQCGYVLALGFDLLDEPMAKKAADRLIGDIEKRGWHLSTGFVGTRDLMQVLSKLGRNDVAFRLLHNTTFPSWGFEVKNGATSIWERWDGWTPEKGFQDPGMNSFAHYAYGAVMGWVYEQVGGINNSAPGFGVLKIAPQIDPHLTHAKTRYDSIRGLISTDWSVSRGKLTLTVEIPANTTAEVWVPVSAGGSVSGDAPGAGRAEAGARVYSVGSGVYRFVSDWR